MKNKILEKFEENTGEVSDCPNFSSVNSFSSLVSKLIYLRFVKDFLFSLDHLFTEYTKYFQSVDKAFPFNRYISCNVTGSNILFEEKEINIIKNKNGNFFIIFKYI